DAIDIDPKAVENTIINTDIAGEPFRSSIQPRLVEEGREFENLEGPYDLILFDAPDPIDQDSEGMSSHRLATMDKSIDMEERVFRHIMEEVPNYLSPIGIALVRGHKDIQEEERRLIPKRLKTAFAEAGGAFLDYPEDRIFKFSLAEVFPPMGGGEEPHELEECVQRESAKWAVDYLIKTGLFSQADIIRVALSHDKEKSADFSRELLARMKEIARAVSRLPVEKGYARRLLGWAYADQVWQMYMESVRTGADLTGGEAFRARTVVLDRKLELMERLLGEKRRARKPGRQFDQESVRESIIETGFGDWLDIAKHILSLVPKSRKYGGLRKALLELIRDIDNYGIDPHQELSRFRVKYHLDRSQSDILGLALGLGWGQGEGREKSEELDPKVIIPEEKIRDARELIGILNQFGSITDPAPKLYILTDDGRLIETTREELLLKSSLLLDDSVYEVIFPEGWEKRINSAGKSEIEKIIKRIRHIDFKDGSEKIVLGYIKNPLLVLLLTREEFFGPQTVAEGYYVACQEKDIMFKHVLFGIIAFGVDNLKMLLQERFIGRDRLREYFTEDPKGFYQMLEEIREIGMDSFIPRYEALSREKDRTQEAFKNDFLNSCALGTYKPRKTRDKERADELLRKGYPRFIASLAGSRLFTEKRLEYLRKLSGVLPEANRRERCLYIASGPDISTSMIVSGGAKETIFVDGLPFNPSVKSTPEEMKFYRGHYFYDKYYGGTYSAIGALLDSISIGMRQYLLWELEAMGVDKDAINIEFDESLGAHIIRFTLSGESEEKRLIYFEVEDAGKQEEYSKPLVDLIKDGVDVYVQKSCMKLELPEDIISIIASSLSVGGAFVIDKDRP
ncbi:MAG: hypothetical protein ACE5JK_07340, partial [Candidatus Omnitrophota bacterium]